MAGSHSALLVCAVLLLLQAAGVQAYYRVASYTVLNPSAGVTTAARGAAFINLCPPGQGCDYGAAANTITIHIAHNVVGATVCHLHYAGNIPGYGTGKPIYNLTDAVNGGCVPYATFSLDSNAVLDAAGTPAANLTDVLQLYGNNYYINVHSATHPSGEITGVLRLFQPGLDFFFEEMTPLGQRGTMAAWYADGTLYAAYYLQDVSSCGICLASSCTLPFTPAFNFTTSSTNLGACQGFGTFAASSATLVNFWSQSYSVFYVVQGVATSKYIRQQYFFATSLQPVSGVSTTASGSATVEFFGSESTLSGSLAQNAQGVTVCHIHYASTPGGTGDPVYNLTNPAGGCYESFSFVANAAKSLISGTPTGKTDMEALLAGQYYVNVHTTQHPGGEITGFLYAQSPALLQIYGGVLLPTTDTPGTITGVSNEGAAIVSVEGNKLIVTVAVQTQYPVTLCHIHYSPTGAGGSGAPIYNMTAADGSCPQVTVFTINTNSANLDDAEQLAAGNYYVNVHTTHYPNGEVRANLYALSAQTTPTPTATATSTGPAPSATPTSSAPKLPNFHSSFVVLATAIACSIFA